MSPQWPAPSESQLSPFPDALPWTLAGHCLSFLTFNPHKNCGWHCCLRNEPHTTLPSEIFFFPQTDCLSPCPPIPPSLLSHTKSALSIIRLENLIEHEIKSSWWPPPPAFTFPTQFFDALLNALETSRSYLLCVLTIPAFTRLSVHHYLPAPPTSGGSHSASAIKASSSTAPLHLSPFTPPCLVPAGGSLSFWPSQSFHFICENHFVLFSHFVLVMAPLTVTLFYPLHVLYRI